MPGCAIARCNIFFFFRACATVVWAKLASLTGSAITVYDGPALVKLACSNKNLAVRAPLYEAWYQVPDKMQSR